MSDACKQNLTIKHVSKMTNLKGVREQDVQETISHS